MVTLCSALVVSNYNITKQANLQGGELGGIGEGVVGNGVSEVVVEVGDGSLSGDNGLDEESEAGEHGEASVLDLLHLELSERLGIVTEAEGVKVLASGVEGVEVLSESVGADASVGAESLSLAHEDDLDNDDGNDGLSVDEARLSEVVEAVLSEDLGTSLEPRGLGIRGLVKLGDEHAEGSEEGPASMDDLNGPVLGEGLGVSRETSSVPTVVTRELSGKVRRSVTLRERSCNQKMKAMRRGEEESAERKYLGEATHQNQAIDYSAIQSYE